ncbi:MAG: hypothetical protein JNL72_13365 [Flavipsychrobacter sp.]|nr:hypothetical protein [Flavipsychrobacter sp.]
MAILSSLHIYAQDVHSVKAEMTSFYIRDRKTDYNPIAQAGLTYTRKIKGNFFVGVTYQQWTNWDRGAQHRLYGFEVPEPAYYSLQDGSMARELLKDKPNFNGHIRVGELITRRGYKMLDISAYYRIVAGPRHIVMARFGISYAAGNGEYLEGFYVSSTTGIIRPVLERRLHRFWGIVPGLSYDYRIFRGAFSVGADFRARYYLQWSSAQYDYGVHVGINF